MFMLAQIGMCECSSFESCLIESLMHHAHHDRSAAALPFIVIARVSASEWKNGVRKASAPSALVAAVVSASFMPASAVGAGTSLVAVASVHLVIFRIGQLFWHTVEKVEQIVDTAADASSDAVLAVGGSVVASIDSEIHKRAHQKY